MDTWKVSRDIRRGQKATGQQTGRQQPLRERLETSTGPHSNIYKRQGLYLSYKAPRPTAYSLVVECVERDIQVMSPTSDNTELTVASQSQVLDHSRDSQSRR